MRSIFNKTLIEIAEKDPRIHMVLADIGYGEIEGFARKFPDRYYNCGVMEQQMTGAACGIALEGGIAVTYSIANFPTLRCLEQIRNDVCYHNANVKIVNIGAVFPTARWVFLITLPKISPSCGRFPIWSSLFPVTIRKRKPLPMRYSITKVLCSIAAATRMKKISTMAMLLL